MAAKMLVGELGVGAMLQLWSSPSGRTVMYDCV
jgi:hypothetical protein